MQQSTRSRYEVCEMSGLTAENAENAGKFKKNRLSDSSRLLSAVSRRAGTPSQGKPRIDMGDMRVSERMLRICCKL